MEKLPLVYQTVVSDVMSQCYTVFNKDGDCTKVLRKLKQLWLKKLLTNVDDYVDLDKFYKEPVPPKLKTKKKSSPTIKMKKNNIIKYSCKSMLKPCNISMPDIGFHEKTSSVFGFQNGIGELPTNGVTCNGTDDVNKLENDTSSSSVAPLKIGKKRQTKQAGLTTEKEIAGPVSEFNVQDEVVSLPKKLKMDNRGVLCDNSQMQTSGIQRKSTQKIRRKFLNPLNVKKKNFKTLDRGHSLIPKKKNSQYNNLKLGRTPHKANHICNGRPIHNSGKSQEQNARVDNVHTLKHNDHHDNFDNADIITASKQDFVETVPDSVTNDKNISVLKTNSSFTTCDGSHEKRPIRLYRKRPCVEQSKSIKRSLEPVTQSDLYQFKQNTENATTNCVTKPCEKMIETGFTGEHKLSPKRPSGEQCANFTITQNDMPLVPNQVSNRRQIRLNRNFVKEDNTLDTNINYERDKRASNVNVVKHIGAQLPCKAIDVMRGNMPQIFQRTLDHTETDLSINHVPSNYTENHITVQLPETLHHSPVDFQHDLCHTWRNKNNIMSTIQSNTFGVEENLHQPSSHSESDIQTINQNNKVKLFDNTKIKLQENHLASTDLPVEIYRETKKYNYTFENPYSHRKNIAKRKKVKIALPARMGFTKDELTCIIKVPPWALQGSKLPIILTPIIRRIHVNKLSILEATSLLQEHINNYEPILQVDGLGVKFILKCKRNSSTIAIRKDIKDNSVIDSDDDVTDEEDIISAFQAKNVIFCQFTNVKHYRNIWRLYLKNGIMRLNGKDYCFSTAEGIVTW